MNAYLDGRASADARALSRFLVVRADRHHRDQRARPRGCSTCRSWTAASSRRWPRTNRTVLEAIPSPRGLIYDRNGRAARHERPDVRREAPPGRSPRGTPARGRRSGWPRCSASTPPTSTPPSTAIPGSSFDLVRIAERRRPRTPPASSPESGLDLPGRRGRRRGTPPVHGRPAAVPDPRLHRARVGRSQLATLQGARATCPTTCSARRASRPTYETELRGTYGTETVERDAAGRKHAGPPDRSRQVRPGDSLDADDRHQGAAARPEGAQVGA